MCVYFVGPYPGAAPPKDGYPVQMDDSPGNEYWSWYSSKVTPAVLPKPDIRPPRVHHRVTRKLSADSLMDYRTFQLEQEALEAQQQDQRYQNMLMQTLGRGSKNSHSHTSLSSLTTTTVTTAKPRTNHEADSRPLPAPSGRMRDLQLGRKPLQIRMEDFRSYKPEVEHKKVPFPDRTLDGMLSIHVMCGHGLKSSRTMLRDLYCVIEVDSVNKARTMIRTGAINFDWDEAFDIDLEHAREVAFLVYSWDPNTRHRLCFSGIVILQAFIQYGSHQKIAVKLEPKGLLYMDVYYKEPALSLQRTPSIRKNALFGVDLETIMKHEKSGLPVPILVKRCVEEVERRGLDHIGIYRLCGSARRKAQLKDEFERNPRNTDLSVDNVSDVNVITGQCTIICYIC